MRETDKEVLHRMCSKIRLSDLQKEDIMKKINEEVSGRKRKSFNVRRFAAVAASVLVLISTTVFVEAKFGIVDRISNLYTAWQSRDVILDEKEKAVINEISLDGGYEFEVEGGTVRVDGIMYDSSFIYLMYTSIADDGTSETVENMFVYEFGLKGSPRIIINGEEYSGGCLTVHEDIDENEEGYQGCCAFRINPIQTIVKESGIEKINNFSLSQGDEIILTDKKYINKNFSISHSLDDIEKIYGTFTLTKPINDLVFTCENTEGMEVLETVTEIRLSPISINVMGDELLRKTYPEGISYEYVGRGDNSNIYNAGGYAASVVKKDGTVAEYATIDGQGSGMSTGDGYEYFYSRRIFEKPLDLAEVDYILVEGWGLEYKIPVNVE